MESWNYPYKWMRWKMGRCVGPAPRPSSFPVWAWLQWENAGRARPDLRARGHLPKGTKGVRIEFECPGKAALLSDFGLWHYVLNYWYLPKSEADEKEFNAELERRGLSFFDTKPLPVLKYHKRIEKSWNRIFNLDRSQNAFMKSRKSRSIQATVWEVRKEQVEDYRCFQAR